MISVILVTYNREQLLSRMLDSIKHQSFQDYELIIVNNGSTDGTTKVCESYAKKNKRVKLLELPQNRGASFGRNSGLALASGEYITFVDDDDYCEPEMLSFLTKLAWDEGADIAMCGSYNEFDHQCEPYFINEEKFTFDRLQGLCELLKRRYYNVAPPTKLFRRALWRDIAFPENVLVDDIHVIYKVFERAQKIVVWNIPLYYFKKHSSNMTAFIHNKQITPELLEEYLAMYQTRAQYLLERAPKIVDQIEDSIYGYMRSMCQQIIENNITTCKKQFDFMEDYIENKRFESLLTNIIKGEK